MRINLDETEIQEALVGFIENQGIDLRHKDVSVELQAGRGTNGHKAFIEILPVEEEKDIDEVPEIPAGRGPSETESAIDF